MTKSALPPPPHHINCVRDSPRRAHARQTSAEHSSLASLCFRPSTPGSMTSAQLFQSIILISTVPMPRTKHKKRRHHTDTLSRPAPSLNQVRASNTRTTPSPQSSFIFRHHLTIHIIKIIYFTHFTHTSTPPWIEPSARAVDHSMKTHVTHIPRLIYYFIINLITVIVIITFQNIHLFSQFHLSCINFLLNINNSNL